MRISDWSSDVCSSDLGIYRRRLTLASGRFAMMEDGLGFQLVPGRPALDPQLGKHISGTMAPGGGVDGSLGKQRGLGIEPDANNPSRESLEAKAGNERASMTLVLTAMTPRYVVQAADRLLTKGAAVHDAMANKTIIYRTRGREHV